MAALPRRSARNRKFGYPPDFARLWIGQAKGAANCATRFRVAAGCRAPCGMSETSLYPTVKRFLEAAGVRVKGELSG
jgi:hypothetical protein